MTHLIGKWIKLKIKRFTYIINIILYNKCYFIKLSFDDNRIKEVGPNIACAEWLMKNGARIRWKGCKEFVNHYDCLPNMKNGSTDQFKIEQVYAGKEASISHIGFRYFSMYLYVLKNIIV